MLYITIIGHGDLVSEMRCSHSREYSGEHRQQPSDLYEINHRTVGIQPLEMRAHGNFSTKNGDIRFMVGTLVWKQSECWLWLDRHLSGWALVGISTKVFHENNDISLERVFKISSWEMWLLEANQSG